MTPLSHNSPFITASYLVLVGGALKIVTIKGGLTPKSLGTPGVTNDCRRRLRNHE
jgi:hypothetical protein